MGMALGTCFKEPDGLTYDEVRFYTSGGDFLGFDVTLRTNVTQA